MTMIHDLHSHSTASDGCLSPAGVVERAARQGVNVLALTDHDTTAGLEEALQAALVHRLQLVLGVEISSNWAGSTVHVVGLNIDPESAVLQQGLRGLRKFRVWRAREIGRRLQRRGIPHALEGARAEAAGADSVSRTHFARYLVGSGHVKSVQEAFRRYLVQGKPGHVPGRWVVLDECIAWIRNAGGQAVLAHPGRYRMTATRLRALLQEFHDHGGEGLEVVSGSQPPDQRRLLGELAHRYGLLGSVGSDFHNPALPWLELGRLPPLPPGVMPIWHSEKWLDTVPRTVGRRDSARL